MGGSIAIAVRFRNGETVCQERWTNNMPFWFTDPKMFAGDEEHVRDYVFGSIRNNDRISDESAPGQPVKVQNLGYGLVVWDYVTNTILDNQGYCGLVYFDTIFAGGRDRYETFVACANDRRIFTETRTIWSPTYAERLNTPHEPSREVRTVRSEILSPEDAIAQGEAAYAKMFSRDRNDDGGGERDYVRFMIDTRPMTYIRFPEGVSMRSKLLELGFPMSQKEGLNKTLKAFWNKQRPLFGATKQECLARDLFQEYKRYDFGKPVDGVPFENLTPESQKEFMDRAAEMLCDPDKVRNFEMARFLQASSRVVTINIEA